MVFWGRKKNKTVQKHISTGHSEYRGFFADKIFRVDFFAIASPSDSWHCHNNYIFLLFIVDEWTIIIICFEIFSLIFHVVSPIYALPFKNVRTSKVRIVKTNWKKSCIYIETETQLQKKTKIRCLELDQ